ncbi:putative IFP53 [Toxoplasma gondii ARI]|uniref:Putative IFP53 n=1 Tax=Toxoplasma gondii ARI TaxID=1074872 RepID=A0A139XTI5_TOXGO|nr:putative IFP53 [Toxoplasma gondii ARI]
MMWTSCQLEESRLRCRSQGEAETDARKNPMDREETRGRQAGEAYARNRSPGEKLARFLHRMALIEGVPGERAKREKVQSENARRKRMGGADEARRHGRGRARKLETNEGENESRDERGIHDGFCSPSKLEGRAEKDRCVCVGRAARNQQGNEFHLPGRQPRTLGRRRSGAGTLSTSMWTRRARAPALFKERLRSEKEKQATEKRPGENTVEGEVETKQGKKTENQER